MALPAGFLDELRNRLPLSAYAGKHLRLSRAGREFKACCPFHQEKTPSFYINDEKSFFHCFGCGANGDIINFAMRFGNLSFPDAVAQLAADAGLEVPQSQPQDKAEYDRQKVLYDLLEWAARWFERSLEGSSGKTARDYLQKRGLSQETQQHFRLGYAPSEGSLLRQAIEQAGFRVADAILLGLLKKPDDGREPYSFFRNRLIFPVTDSKGRVVAFGARLLAGDGPKYINSPDHPLFHKGQLLYNLAQARGSLSTERPFIVVEGYMDVITLVAAGFKGAVAPLGTAMTESQIELLWRLQQNRPELTEISPLLCFDGDEAGNRAAYRATDRFLPLVTSLRTFRIAHMPQGDDPDSLIRSAGAKAFTSVLAQAKPLFASLWDHHSQARDLSSPEARAHLQAELEQKLATIADPALRSFYQRELKDRVYKTSRIQVNPKAATSSIRWQGKGKSQAPRTIPTLLRQPKAAAPMKERILLALLINHPLLFQEVGEDFAHYPFTDPALEKLRLQLIGYFESHHSLQSLDAAAINSYLCESAENQEIISILQVILSDQTYLHAGFARANRPLHQARMGWQGIWNAFIQGEVLEEKRHEGQAFSEALSDGASENRYDRLLALHDAVEAHSDAFDNEIEDREL